jgi:23S rRNA (adenine1618-N6)-methyltransferase
MSKVPKPMEEKISLHHRNRHQGKYDFKILGENFPALIPYVHVNQYDNETIDFSDPVAVKLLNTSLLKQYYDIEFWEFPENFLCPPVPGRADYIHYVADLIKSTYDQKGLENAKIKCLDIGVGANCIYPIIGIKEYGWKFIGSEIDQLAFKACQKIIENNSLLKGNVELRHQSNSKNIFHGILKKGEFIDLSICNPPFHASIAEAVKGTQRKWKNLKNIDKDDEFLNFGGRYAEIATRGGEKKFIREMIFQSKDFSTSCFWFSTLVSKKSNIGGIIQLLRSAEALDIKVIPMGQGNKISRIVAWTYLNSKQQRLWKRRKKREVKEDGIEDNN